MTTMAGERAALTLSRLSSESLREATGRGWEEWLEALDGAGAADWSHKEIVACLEREHPEVSSGWWRQSITVGYEQARGKRAVGETPGAGFQVGVQRTVAATATEAWELIPWNRLRMTWQPEGWPAPATLQLKLLVSGAGKTAIHAQLEKLPDTDARDAMRTHWRAALERIATGRSLTS